MKANVAAVEAWSMELRRGPADPARRAVLEAELRRELPALVDQLERGWAWCEANRRHPEIGQREDRWLEWLRAYENACQALGITGLEAA